MKHVAALIAGQACTSRLSAIVARFVTQFVRDREHIDGILIDNVFEGGSGHKRAGDVSPLAVAGAFQRATEHRAQATHLIREDNKTRSKPIKTRYDRSYDFT